MNEPSGGRKPPANDAAVRAMEMRARVDVDSYERELASEPFWRFLRRRGIRKALASAREEESALRRLRIDP